MTRIVLEDPDAPSSSRSRSPRRRAGPSVTEYIAELEQTRRQHAERAHAEQDALIAESLQHASDSPPPTRSALSLWAALAAALFWWASGAVQADTEQCSL